LRTDVSLEDIKSRLGGRLSGGTLLTICPFHEDRTPSLAVYADQHYYCFGCQAHGPLRDLLAAAESPSHVVLVAPDRSASWFDRPKWNRDGEKLTAYVERSHIAMVSQLHVQWYPEQRRLESAIGVAGLGWDLGWLIVPVTDRTHDVVGVVGRAYPHVASKTGMRYDLPRGQGPLQYVPNWEMWNEAEMHYIVFGVLDAISMAVAGIAAASPTAGKGSFDPRWLDHEDQEVVVIPDRHEDRDAFDLAGRLDWRGQVRLLQYEAEEDDCNDILVRRGPEGLADAVAKNFRGRRGSGIRC